MTNLADYLLKSYVLLFHVASIVRMKSKDKKSNRIFYFPNFVLLFSTILQSNKKLKKKKCVPVSNGTKAHFKHLFLVA